MDYDTDNDKSNDKVNEILGTTQAANKIFVIKRRKGRRGRKKKGRMKPKPNDRRV